MNKFVSVDWSTKTAGLLEKKVITDNCLAVIFVVNLRSLKFHAFCFSLVKRDFDICEKKSSQNLHSKSNLGQFEKCGAKVEKDIWKGNRDNRGSFKILVSACYCALLVFSFQLDDRYNFSFHFTHISTSLALLAGHVIIQYHRLHAWYARINPLLRENWDDEIFELFFFLFPFLVRSRSRLIFFSSSASRGYAMEQVSGRSINLIRHTHLGIENEFWIQ